MGSSVAKLHAELDDRMQKCVTFASATIARSNDSVDDDLARVGHRRIDSDFFDCIRSYNAIAFDCRVRENVHAVARHSPLGVDRNERQMIVQIARHWHITRHKWY